jgi:hypothetical protein
LFSCSVIQLVQVVELVKTPSFRVGPSTDSGTLDYSI